MKHLYDPMKAFSLPVTQTMSGPSQEGIRWGPQTNFVQPPPAGLNMAPCGGFSDPQIYRRQWITNAFPQAAASTVVMRPTPGQGFQNTFIPEPQTYMMDSPQASFYPHYFPAANAGMPTPGQGFLNTFIPEPKTYIINGQQANIYPHYLPSGNRGRPTPGHRLLNASMPQTQRYMVNGHHANIYHPYYIPSGNRGRPTQQAKSFIPEPQRYTMKRYQAGFYPQTVPSDNRWRSCPNNTQQLQSHQKMQYKDSLLSGQKANTQLFPGYPGGKYGQTIPINVQHQKEGTFQVRDNRENLNTGFPVQVLLKEAMKILDYIPEYTEPDNPINTCLSPLKEVVDASTEVCSLTNNSISDFNSLNLPDEMITPDYSIDELTTADYSLQEVLVINYNCDVSEEPPWGFDPC